MPYAQARLRNPTSNAASAALVDVNKPLTTMQVEFVKNWAAGESIANAGARAGYHDGGAYAYRMAKMPNILKRYNIEKAAFERANDMSRKKVMEGFQDGIAMAAMLGEPASVIAGWREIGRMCGYYEPVMVKHQVSVEGKVMVERMNRMTDEELFALIQKSSQDMDTPILPLLEDDHAAGI
jgi:phage terminase small subunit